MCPPRSTLFRRLQRGVTVVELAIVLAIVATLVTTVGPDFSGLVANAQLRGATDGLRGGLRHAQIEAIKRQEAVELVLTEDRPDTAVVSPSTQGRNWVIRVPLANGGYELLQSSEGAAASPRVRVGADRSVFAFDSFGRLRADSTGRAAPAGALRVEFTDRESRGRALRVVVQPAGSSQSCDPQAAGGGPFACG